MMRRGACDVCGTDEDNIRDDKDDDELRIDKFFY